MGIISIVLGILFAAETPSWAVTVGEVEVNWSLGTMIARGAAAADIRMPGPNASRARSERQAIAAADAKLRSALDSLAGRSGETLSIKGITTFMERAETDRIEFQSNGGVVLWRAIRFLRASEDKKTNLPLVPVSVRSMPFRVAPAIQSAHRHVAPAFAIYRHAPAPVHALAARWDARTGLILDASVSDRIDKLATAGIEIFIENQEP
jgi:hypothetical protein